MGEPTEGSELSWARTVGVGQPPSPRHPRSMSELWGREESQDSFLWLEY